MAFFGKMMICPNPNCGFEGKMKKRSRGSTLLLVLLFCLGIIPGVIYLCLASGWKYTCPNCHNEWSSA